MRSDKTVHMLSLMQKNKGKVAKKATIRESVRRAGIKIRNRDSVKAFLKANTAAGFLANMFGFGAKREGKAKPEAAEPPAAQPEPKPMSDPSAGA